jgi:hypothetical protein
MFALEISIIIQVDDKAKVKSKEKCGVTMSTHFLKFVLLSWGTRMSKRNVDLGFNRRSLHDAII